MTWQSSLYVRVLSKFTEATELGFSACCQRVMILGRSLWLDGVYLEVCWMEGTGERGDGRDFFAREG